MATTKTVGMLVGNPRPGSRTSQVARAVAESVAEMIGGAAILSPIELGTYGPAVLDPFDAAVGNARTAMAAADAVVVASPTYKATYTGLLKTFLDGYGTNGLAGVIAIPVMVGGAPEHALATEVHLRPLLIELGAVVPSRGLFVLDSRLDELDDIVRTWGVESAGSMRALTGPKAGRP